MEMRRVRPSLQPTVLLVLFLGVLATSRTHAETVRVVIEKFAYSPADAAAKVGDTIEWINDDLEAHSVTDAEGHVDLMLAPGTSARLVLERTGIMEYHCRFHRDMRGRLTVSSD